MKPAHAALTSTALPPPAPGAGAPLGRAPGAERERDVRRDAGRDAIGRDRRDDDLVDLVRRPAGVLERERAGAGRELGQRLGGGGGAGRPGGGGGGGAPP